MSKKIADLRSDTLTKPSEDMRRFMSEAIVGDDVYGEDPTVNSLEERVAELFGHEAALFCPTGSLANQLAIRMLVAPGEELITETNSHIVFSGITTRTWLSPRGELKAEDALNIARPDSGPYLVSTKAIAVENTHNFGGGTIQQISEIKKLSQECQTLGISTHLDGARIWNAHVATGVTLKDYGKYFDTLSVCLSKGLGAPIGSLMISTADRISKARQWRKRYGGGMRQVGIMAAAGHYALENNLKLLKTDHVRAKAIAEAIAAVAPSVIDPKTVETNIVGLDLSSTKLTALELAAKLKEHGILTGPLGSKYLRLVTHYDLDEADINLVKQVLPEILNRSLMAQ